LLTLGSVFFRPAPPPARTVLAADNNHPQVIFSADSTARTIIDAFQQAGLPYYPEDKVSAFPDPSLGLGTVITVTRALPVSVVDGKKRYELRTWQQTVEGLLAEKKIELGAEDRIAPSLGTPLGPNLSVSITRVARTEVSEFETIAFKTVEKENSTMWRGETRVTQAGKNGKREKRYLVIREDGELVSKTLIANVVVESVIDKIIEVGTKLKIGKTLTGKATWYNCCGTKVAMDVFPRGTEVRVTNLSNGRSIIVRNDGCICGAQGVLIDLHPSLFQQLGGTLGQGVIGQVRVEQILPYP
jgi:uncharacterized protein YabE (DUF348 family)